MRTPFALAGTGLSVLTLLFASAATGANIPANEEATFNTHISRIVHKHCASCHRPGQAAPFSLLTYEDVSKRAQLVAAVTQTRYMPPWHAEPGYGAFKGERRMADSEIALIQQWVASGAPEGGGAPPDPPEFSARWILGEPDVVVTMEEPYVIPADGPDIYRNFPAQIPVTGDKWLRAFQFRPHARAVVHHSLFKADPTGRARQLDSEDDEPGYGGMGSGAVPRRISLGGWAVGGQARVMPPGGQILIPAGSDFVFESHFHPSGKEETEVSEIALYFTDEPATRTRLSIQLPPRFGLGAGIDIAPGDSEFTIGESITLPAAIELYGVTPHAHYIGKEFKSWAELPDGSEIPLIWIKDWDFAWQDMYVYEKPVVVPAGATIHARIRYDNSAENPRNPSSPPKRVFWGRGSEDEMGTVIFTAMPVDEADVPALREELGNLRMKHIKLIRQYLTSIPRRRTVRSGR